MMLRTRVSVEEEILRLHSIRSLLMEVEQRGFLLRVPALILFALLLNQLLHQSHELSIIFSIPGMF